MDVIVERQSALDVHKAQVTACVRVPGEGRERVQEVAQFTTTVRGLLVLRDWLQAHGVTHVVMEATGDYCPVQPVVATLPVDEAILPVCWFSILRAPHIPSPPSIAQEASQPPRQGWPSVLAKQSVGVLVAAALPGALGVAEEDLDAGVDPELSMLGHL